MTENPAENRILHVLHFNDVYNIEASNKEPVGGAAKFVGQVKSLQHLNPLVLFSGDCYNPSLMSTVTNGKQMVPILNMCGVKAAAVGNHDLDWGLDTFEEMAAQCDFPWLLANVLDKSTGEPLGGAERSLLMEWGGVRIGLLGLAEGEWVDTLSAVEPEDVSYVDFVEEGRRLAQQLRAEGAELVFALTHMRAPNDTKLAQAVPEIDLVLGGHDHFYEVSMIEPHFNLMVKSGTDFRDLTLLTLEVPPHPQQQQQQQRQPGSAQAPPASHEGLDGLPGEVGDGMALASGRAKVKWQHLQVTSAVPDDEEAAKVVQEFADAMGASMDMVVGSSLVDLDGRFNTVRRQESNLGNLICDVFRRACNADIVIMNSGTFRSDQIHPAGPLTYRDLVSILPMMDDTVVVEASGEQVVAALENGVSHYPALEGRFPQVSGLSFAFDPTKPVGSRVVADSVKVNSQPLQGDKKYLLATKAYLAEGKDGYDVLESCRVVQDSEICPLLPTVIRRFFMILDVLNKMDPKTRLLGVAKRWHNKAKSHGSLAALEQQGSEQQQQQGQEDSALTCKVPAKGQQVKGACVRHPDLGMFVVAPAVEGRIVCVHPTADQSS